MIKEIAVGAIAIFIAIFLIWLFGVVFGFFASVFFLLVQIAIVLFFAFLVGKAVLFYTNKKKEEH